MTEKRLTKIRFVKLIFGGVFAVINLLGVVAPSTGVMADEYNVDTAIQNMQAAEMTEVVTPSGSDGASDTGVQNGVAENDAQTDDVQTTAEQNANAAPVTDNKSCKESMGAIGWLVCPATGVIANAVDWLYERIESVLVINPVEMKDGAPIYEIWKYMRGITNVIFIIFLLVMVYSQVTGLGITNYGLKKTLPKLIVGAILVNLSFIVCSLAVDASNIVGNGLRGMFEAIEINTVGNAGVSNVTVSQMYSALGGVAGAGVLGGALVLEAGTLWMLIPTVLGALVAVVIGLVTIALRQAVVALLIMIAPLAVVAYILPNTEQWFRKWRHLLFQMLIFYPMFSLLFGASSLAGFAIIASARDGFMMCLGIAVQIFPLFFAWSLMRMSGTFLSGINAKLSALAAKPIAINRAWAESRRDLTNAKNLARADVYTPSLRLRQFLSDRKIARLEGTTEHLQTVKNRGLAYGANSHYDKDGKLNRDGERAFAEMSRNLTYQEIILRHKTNFDEGVEGLERKGNYAQLARLKALDGDIIYRADRLKMEMARAEQVAYRNARGFYQRMDDAINAHMDETKGYMLDENGNRIADPEYKFHFDPNSDDFKKAMARYGSINAIMKGNMDDIHYAAAYAAHAYGTQSKIMMTKMQNYFDLTAPTEDVRNRLSELTLRFDAGKEIDAIIPGLRILAMRGDTDIIREQIENIFNSARAEEGFSYADIEDALKNNNEKVGVHVGTHASQALASFLMFDVGDKDPTLKRLGKYINLETAHAYNKNKRKNTMLSLEEYMQGKYDEYVREYDEDGNITFEGIREQDPSRGMTTLLEGTSFDNVERTAYRNLDQMLMNAYRRSDGSVDVEKYLKRREQVETAIGPQFISASLKYLSGSEQLKSAVDFLTGYNKGQERWHYDEDKSKRGELASTPEDAAYAEAYFRRKTEQYFRDQTPTQILGLRTDYREPVVRHLMESLFEEKPELRAEYNAEMADIQNRYGDMNADEAKKLRAADEKALKMKYTGDRLREILDKSGKLEQIYRTRRSGAANNAKDWLRDWLLLNDEDGILRYLDQKQQDRYYERTGKRPVENGSQQSDGADGGFSLYNQEDRIYLIKEIGKIHEQNMSDEDFYQMTHDALEKELGKNRLITKLYEQFRKEAPSADKDTLMDKLTELIEDPDNYEE